MSSDSLQNKSLIILRGLPGAGKSSLSGVLSENGKYPVFSVDDYFMNETGNYEFRFEENHLAYKQCENNVKLACEQRIEKIFVDNVFSLDWEMEPYFKLAAEFDYRIFVCTVENYHKGNNVHGVNREQLEKIAAKYKVKLI